MSPAPGQVIAPAELDLDPPEARPRPRLARLGRLPGWAHAVLVMAACQLLTALLLDRAARFTLLDHAGHTSRWSYLAFVARWDSAWYRRIAEGGYPSVLPIDGTGHVAQNEWAFYPLFPTLARGLMVLPGVGWALAGWLVAVLSALAAAVLLRLLVDRLVGPSLALWSVALLGSFTTAAVLQFPYSDALGLALLLAVLCCLQGRHYALAAPLLVLVGLARPIAVPLAVVVVVHAVRRLRRRPLTAGLLVAAAAVGAVVWPVTAALATGRRSAYTDTMAAWRYGRGLVPVEPWLDASARYLGGFVGRALLIAVPLALLWWLTRPAARLLGADLRVWCVAYGGYLLAVLDPTTSLARYLLLFFPLGILLVAASPSPAFRRALVVFGFVTQLVWIVTVWRINGFPP